MRENIKLHSMKLVFKRRMSTGNQCGFVDKMDKTDKNSNQCGFIDKKGSRTPVLDLLGTVIVVRHCNNYLQHCRYDEYVTVFLHGI